MEDAQTQVSRELTPDSPGSAWIGSRAEYEYDIFISYRSVDGRPSANWLSTSLRSYRAPRGFDGTLDPLRVYRDVELERVTPAIWDQRIRPALARSRFLLVVLTPSVLNELPNGHPNWVVREFTEFVQLPQGSNMMVARANGSGDFRIPSELATRFPEPGWVDIRSANHWWSRLINRSALRDKLTAIAVPALDIDDKEIPVFNRLAERDKRRLAWITAIVSGLLLIVLSALSVTTVLQRTAAVKAASQARDEATLARIAEQKARSAAVGERTQRKIAQATAEREREARKEADIQRTRAEDESAKLAASNVALQRSQEKERHALADELLAFPGPPKQIRTAGWKSAADLGLRGDISLQPGVSIGLANRDSPTGTLCCIVEDPSGKRYLLAMAPVWPWRSGASVLYPGVADRGKQQPTVVGKLVKRGSDPIRSGVLAELTEGVHWDNSLPHIKGRSLLLPVSNAPALGIGPPVMPVHILGRGSGLVIAALSSITDEEIEIYVPEGSLFSEPGDEGALVLNLQHELIGLVWGGGGKNAFAVPIQRVFSELGVRLANKR